MGPVSVLHLHFRVWGEGSFPFPTVSYLETFELGMGSLFGHREWDQDKKQLGSSIVSWALIFIVVPGGLRGGERF